MLAMFPPTIPRSCLAWHLALVPSSGNPRNSEGDPSQLKDGKWLFVYTHFTGESDDHPMAFLASRESSDGGKTWSEHDEIAIPNVDGFNVMLVFLLRLQSAEIALFYLRKNPLQDCRPVMRVSRDEARTWSAPMECITDEFGFYVLNNNRVIQLESGRLVMSKAMYGYIKGRLQAGKIMTFLSDDQG